MTDPYDEVIDGREYIRGPINGPHELLCDRLHTWVKQYLPVNSALHLLRRRSLVKLRADTDIRPDLALMRRNAPRLYLAVEVLQTGDRHADTVLKKQILAACQVPRLWIVDPRYQTIELYVTTGGQFRLETMLGLEDSLTDVALSGASYRLSELFARRRI